MHISSLEAQTTLNTYNLWKLALRGHLNTDARTRDRTLSQERCRNRSDKCGRVLLDLNYLT